MRAARTYIFKDPGSNLALKRGFTAIACRDNDLDAHLYAAYSPGLPLLYGLFASIFGCNGYSNTYFDLIIAAATLQLSESDRASGS